MSGDLHPTDMLLATIDGNGSVLCREVGNTDNLYCQFNPVEDEGCDAPESAYLCFNKQDPNQMFIAVNSSIFIYQTEDVISGYIKVQTKQVSQNIQRVEQQGDLLVLMHSDSIACLRIVDDCLQVVGEYPIEGSPLSGLLLSENNLIIAKSDGDLTMYH